MRSEGYCSCRPYKGQLTSGASVRPENAVTYSNIGENICGDFSVTASLQLPPLTGHRYDRPFSCGYNKHAHRAYPSSAKCNSRAPCRKVSLRSI